jgi:hypothetical protein
MTDSVRTVLRFDREENFFSGYQTAARPQRFATLSAFSSGLSGAAVFHP